MTGVVESGVDGRTGRRGGDVTSEAGHELLVRLAGRLPDDVLWRLRDWLAAGAVDPVAAVLPRALLRHRLGITDDERELLTRCVDEHSPSRRTVDTVLPLAEIDDPGTAFVPGEPTPDLAAMSAASVVAGHPGTQELRQSWRVSGGGRRVLLVLGADRPWELTGTLQRLLRVHGDHVPCVEVLPLEMEVPAYHQSAVVGSSVLWASPSDPASADLPSAYGPGASAGD